MTKRKAIHRRIWLAPNDCNSMASAQYTIDSYTDEGEMEISIADCYRTINFQLNCRADQRKIQKLIDFLKEAIEVHVKERNA